MLFIDVKNEKVLCLGGSLECKVDIWEKVATARNVLSYVNGWFVVLGRLTIYLRKV